MTEWTAGGNLGTARSDLAGGGDSSDAICMGGDTSSSKSNVTEEYNGSSWSAGGNLGTARSYLAGGGNSSNAICMGGYTGSISNVTEEYIAETETVGGGAIWM